MKLTNNIENDDKRDSGGTLINKISNSNSNSNQLNPSIIKILSANNSPSPVSMLKSSSMASVTSATTTSSLTSTLVTSQIINNSESEIITKRDSNEVSNANQITYDNVSNSINKATQYNKSPKHSVRSSSTHSLEEYYSSSPIPTPKPRSITKANTTPLPSYSYNSNLNLNLNVDSTNSVNQFEEFLNEFSYIYSEEELSTYNNVTNFICKIAQLILRSRVGLSYNHNYYSQQLGNKKIQNKNNGLSDRVDHPLNSLSNSMAGMNIKAAYASSISSNESQAQSIPYSLNSSYTSSFENSYALNPNGVMNSYNSYTRSHDFYIPTPSIENIKQLHGLLIDRMPFWKNRIPINIDIFAGGNGNNSYGKMGNDNYRRKSHDYTYGNDMERDHEDSYFERPSTSSTRIRSSSISNVYPKYSKNSISSTTKFNNKRLLERWVVSYEPSSDYEAMNKGRNSNKVDTTDFILLVQSLYSYIRLMPLHSLLSDNSVQKTDLQYCISTADGFLLLPSLEEQNDIEFCDIGSSGFDLSAKLKVYKFTKASTNLGNLLISVVYDANINNKNPSAYPSNLSHSISKIISNPSSSLLYNDTNNYPKSTSNLNTNTTLNTFTATTTSNSTIISPKESSSQDNISSSKLPNESSISSNKNEDETTKDKMDKKSDTPTNDEPSSPNSRRKSCPTIGSPFPSPKTHTKVLSLTQAKYSFQPQSSSLSSSTPTLLHQLMNKQRMEKYSSSVHSLSDNNSLSSHSNLLLSGFNYKKNGINDSNANDHNKYNYHSPINIPKMTPLDNKNNTKVLSNHLTPSSINKNRDNQNNSIELFGSLVGSYEESILSGRMSTLPSKPIKFISEIGVIGFGKCHPRLKCPPHINITFPVYFYEIPDHNDFFTTPYVGTVDIEQYLQKQNLLKQQKQQLQQQQEDQTSSKDESEGKLNHNLTMEPLHEKEESEDLNSKDNNGNTSTTLPSVILLNDEPILPRASSTSSLNGSSAKFPGYRIPFKGQIQVIIKNPSKTAVKVFLIPYDFRDMPPNTKTFIRQKSYLKNIKNNRNPHDQKYSLRYAIHLQFISPSKKKLYLYKTLRVVFAHKAPEKDEKLYTISDGPVDPKYIPIVDNSSSKNYSHSTGDLNSDHFYSTELSLRPEGHGLSVKDENNLYPSSFSSSRRRSSFGSNAMMLAEMGVNLGDYSVSPVKPMLIHQHRRSLSNGSNSSTSQNGYGITTTKGINPLYFGNSLNHSTTTTTTITNTTTEFQKYFNDRMSQEQLTMGIPSKSSTTTTTGQRLHPQQQQQQQQPYSYLNKMHSLDKISTKLPPRINEELKSPTTTTTTTTTTTSTSTSNYSSGGLTKMVSDPPEPHYYPKSTGKKHLSESNHIMNPHPSLSNLTQSNLETELHDDTSTSSPNYFNYIN